MKHDEATRYFDELGAGIESRPRVPDLLVAGRNAERRKRRRTVMASVAAVALILGGGAVVQQATAGDEDTVTLGEPGKTCPPGQSRQDPQETRPLSVGPDYPVNRRGQTYGSMGPGDHLGPDLVAVYGDCGQSGYALREDLDDPAPWMPDAGLAGEARTIPVYESDGVTQIDTFTMGAAEDESSSDVEATNPAGPGTEDVQGTWLVTIAGIRRADGSQQFDTYRDVRLTVTVRGNSLSVWDGCVTSMAAFELDDGEFALTPERGSEAATSKAGCDRQAPLVAILENIRHVTTSRGDVYLHLDNFQIALVLQHGPA